MKESEGRGYPDEMALLGGLMPVLPEVWCLPGAVADSKDYSRAVRARRHSRLPESLPEDCRNYCMVQFEDVHGCERSCALPPGHSYNHDGPELAEIPTNPPITVHLWQAWADGL